MRGPSTPVRDPWIGVNRRCLHWGATLKQPPRVVALISKARFFSYVSPHVCSLSVHQVWVWISEPRPGPRVFHGSTTGCRRVGVRLPVNRRTPTRKHATPTRFEAYAYP